MRKFLYILTAAIVLSSCNTDNTEDIAIDDFATESLTPAPIGRTRSYGEALQLARQSIEIVDGTEATRASKIRTIRNGKCVTRQSTRSDGSAQTDTLVYVFNFNDNAGFSIIAANTLSEPIIAVTENGSYTYGEPTGNNAFDTYINTAIASSAMKIPGLKDSLLTYPVQYTIKVDEKKDCDPLLPVNWGQNGRNKSIYVYGEYCPNNIAGCVATAMAQIMAYHKRPESITTTYSNAPHAQETIELDWESMINYIGWDIATYCEHIPILMREIGERVHMDYSNPTQSITFDSYVTPAFKSFGYVWPTSTSSFKKEFVYNSLDKKRPVYVSGKKINDIIGHSWVADGYKSYRIGTETYVHKSIYPGAPIDAPDYILVESTVEETQLLHYNWGYDGKCNGFFKAIDTCDIIPNNPGYDNPEEYISEQYYNTFIDLKIITDIK